MGWKPDIALRMKGKYAGGKIPSGLEQFYWEINFMIHLLDNYSYGTMSADTVSVAMNKFVARVILIPTSELRQATINSLAQTLVDIANEFAASSEPSFKMYDLYTRPIPDPSRKRVVSFFATFQKQLAKGKVFKGSANSVRACIPFLQWQRTGKGFVKKWVMDAFITEFATSSLPDLINKSHSSCSPDEEVAIRVAKDHGILLTPRPPLIVEFNNRLECGPVGGGRYECQPADPGFCLSANDGTCSAMSG